MKMKKRRAITRATRIDGPPAFSTHKLNELDSFPISDRFSSSIYFVSAAEEEEQRDFSRNWSRVTKSVETMRKFSYVNYVNYARSEIDFLNIIPPFRNLYVSCEKLSNLICCTRRQVKWTESLTRQTYLNDLRFNIVIRSIRGSFETVYAPSDFLKSFKCQTTRRTTDKCPIKRW